MSLDKRIDKLEEQQPALNIAAEIIAARSIKRRTPTSEIEQLARRHGGMYARILQGRHTAGIE